MQAPRWGLPKPSKAPKETPEQRQELEAVKQRIAQFASRWDVKRVEESGDAAGREARVGAAKALLTLATYLSTHPSARKPEVRHLLTQDVNWVALLRPLLACEDAAPSCVRGLATLTKLLPGLVPQQAAVDGLFALLDASHSTPSLVSEAARVLHHQSGTWRLSTVWITDTNQQRVINALTTWLPAQLQTLVNSSQTDSQAQSKAQGTPLAQTIATVGNQRAAIPVPPHSPQTDPQAQAQAKADRKQGARSQAAVRPTAVPVPPLPAAAVQGAAASLLQLHMRLVQTSDVVVGAMMNGAHSERWVRVLVQWLYLTAHHPDPSPNSPITDICESVLTTLTAVRGVTWDVACSDSDLWLQLVNSTARVLSQLQPAAVKACDPHTLNIMTCGWQLLSDPRVWLQPQQPQLQPGACTAEHGSAAPAAHAPLSLATQTLLSHLALCYDAWQQAPAGDVPHSQQGVPGQNGSQPPQHAGPQDGSAAAAAAVAAAAQQGVRGALVAVSCSILASQEWVYGEGGGGTHSEGVQPQGHGEVGTNRAHAAAAVAAASLVAAPNALHLAAACLSVLAQPPRLVDAPAATAAAAATPVSIYARFTLSHVLPHLDTHSLRTLLYSLASKGTYPESLTAIALGPPPTLTTHTAPLDTVKTTEVAAIIRRSLPQLASAFDKAWARDIEGYEWLSHLGNAVNMVLSHLEVEMMDACVRDVESVKGAETVVVALANAAVRAAQSGPSPATAPATGSNSEQRWHWALTLSLLVMLLHKAASTCCKDIQQQGAHAEPHSSRSGGTPLGLQAARLALLRTCIQCLIWLEPVRAQLLGGASAAADTEDVQIAATCLDGASWVSVRKTLEGCVRTMACTCLWPDNHYQPNSDTHTHTTPAQQATRPCESRNGVHSDSPMLVNCMAHQYPPCAVHGCVDGGGNGCDGGVSHTVRGQTGAQQDMLLTVAVVRRLRGEVGCLAAMALSRLFGQIGIPRALAITPPTGPSPYNDPTPSPTLHTLTHTESNVVTLHVADSVRLYGYASVLAQSPVLRGKIQTAGTAGPEAAQPLAVHMKAGVPQAELSAAIHWLHTGQVALTTPTHTLTPTTTPHANGAADAAHSPHGPAAVQADTVHSAGAASELAAMHGDRKVLARVAKSLGLHGLATLAKAPVPRSGEVLTWHHAGLDPRVLLPGAVHVARLCGQGQGGWVVRAGGAGRSGMVEQSTSSEAQQRQTAAPAQQSQRTGQTSESAYGSVQADSCMASQAVPLAERAAVRDSHGMEPPRHACEPQSFTEPDTGTQPSATTQSGLTQHMDAETGPHPHIEPLLLHAIEWQTTLASSPVPHIVSVPQGRTCPTLPQGVSYAQQGAGVTLGLPPFCNLFLAVPPPLPQGGVLPSTFDDSGGSATIALLGSHREVLEAGGGPVVQAACSPAWLHTAAHGLTPHPHNALVTGHGDRHVHYHSADTQAPLHTAAHVHNDVADAQAAMHTAAHVDDYNTDTEGPQYTTSQIPFIVLPELTDIDTAWSLLAYIVSHRLYFPHFTRTHPHVVSLQEHGTTMGCGEGAGDTGAGCMCGSRMGGPQGCVFVSESAAGETGDEGDVGACVSKQSACKSSGGGVAGGGCDSCGWLRTCLRLARCAEALLLDDLGRLCREALDNALSPHARPCALPATCILTLLRDAALLDQGWAVDTLLTGFERLLDRTLPAGGSDGGAVAGAGPRGVVGGGKGQVAAWQETGEWRALPGGIASVCLKMIQRALARAYR